MALSVNVYNIRPTASANNVNGGGFNPNNANMLTDLAGTSANTASPVVSSASYTFTAGDVGAWVFIQSGTNWTPGWYQIVSVSAGAATLSAGVGAANNWNSSMNGYISLNTVAGCATTASPSSGVFTVDYTRQDAAQLTNTDLTSLANSTTVTSALGTFTPVMVGNLIHLSSLTGSGSSVGWYEIVSYTDAHNVVLDRTPDASNAITAGTYYVGGAFSLGSSTSNQTDATITGLGPTSGTGQWWLIQNGTYALGANFGVNSSTAGTPTFIQGYNEIPCDLSYDGTFTNYPVLNLGTSRTFSSGSNNNVSYLQLLGSGNTSPISFNGNTPAYYVKVIVTASNTSTQAIRLSQGASLVLSEVVCCKAIAVGPQSNSIQMFGNYIHHSDQGIFLGSSGTGQFIDFNIFESMVTAGVEVGNNNTISIKNNTFYGGETPLGAAVTISTGTGMFFGLNNLYYGLETALDATDNDTASQDTYGDFYNNTTDSVYVRMNQNISVDPAFTNVVERTGATATTGSGNTFVQSGATFVTWDINPNTDYLYVSGGTGVTPGIYPILSVDSETQLTLGMTISADATADKTWVITQGHNFLPTGDI